MLDPRLKELYQKIEECEAREAWLELVPIYQKCIEISLDVYGENHVETLALYTEYGGLLRNLGRYEESLSILQKAIDLSINIVGKNHPDYASALVNMANLLRMMKYHEQSEKLFLQAKAIYEKTIGKKAFQYAGLCNNLGLLYQAMGRYDEAIPLHRTCLDILGVDSSHEILYGVTLNNLVEPYKHTGQRDQAILVLERATAIFKKYIDHAATLYAAAMNNLASIYYEDGNYEEALRLFKIALDISKEKLGIESESYKNSLKNYKMTEEKLSKKKEFHITQESKGLELAEAYFYDVCYPMLKREFPEHINRMAAGLIGEGSECFGYDDMISRDHDFGPSFQIYIPAEDIPVYGKKLRAEVNKLPTSYAGFGERNTSTYGGGRIGLFSIEDFYDKFLSIHEVPSSNSVWLQLSDIPLSTVTNGKVFMDRLGTFTEIREGLLKHYPKDVCLKKLAYHCTQIAQSGQYNFPRSLKRKQYVAAHHALDEFLTHYASAVYLLNKVYKPYYKWEHEGLKRLPILGGFTHKTYDQIVSLSFQDQEDQIIFLIENLCSKLISVMKSRQYTSSQSDFLLDHVSEIMSKITDPNLRNSNPWL